MEIKGGKLGTSRFNSQWLELTFQTGAYAPHWSSSASNLVKVLAIAWEGEHLDATPRSPLRRITWNPRNSGLLCCRPQHKSPFCHLIQPGSYYSRFAKAATISWSKSPHCSNTSSETWSTTAHCCDLRSKTYISIPDSPKITRYSALT